MKIGIVISTDDAETIWNALRFANLALSKGDKVEVFLIGKGVECEYVGSEKFNIVEQVGTFSEKGGKIYACGTCLKARQMKGTETCPLSTLQDLYDIVASSDKILVF